jgi:hypothetical protein
MSDLSFVPGFVPIIEVAGSAKRVKIDRCKER